MSVWMYLLFLYNLEYNLKYKILSFTEVLFYFFQTDFIYMYLFTGG